MCINVRCKIVHSDLHSRTKKTKKNNLELLESEKIADALYHFIYKKDEIQIHSYYYIGDLKDALERYLFVFNGDFL